MTKRDMEHFLKWGVLVAGAVVLFALLALAVDRGVSVLADWLLRRVGETKDSD